MQITLQCTSISLSTIISQNQLNPIMQRAKIDRSVRRGLPGYDNGCVPSFSYSNIMFATYNVHKTNKIFIREQLSDLATAIALACPHLIVVKMKLIRSKGI